jgi:hypothetical protein
MTNYGESFEFQLFQFTTNVNYKRQSFFVIGVFLAVFAVYFLFFIVIPSATFQTVDNLKDIFVISFLHLLAFSLLFVLQFFFAVVLIGNRCDLMNKFLR